jgi:hypothetical protein
MYAESNARPPKLELFAVLTVDALFIERKTDFMHDGLIVCMVTSIFVQKVLKLCLIGYYGKSPRFGGHV